MAVKNVKEFLEELEKAKASINSKDGLLVYRGHEVETWKLTPSLYRNISNIKHEHKFINDAIIGFPNDLQKHETNFEKLAFLQHYGIPTRLLDLSENPLVGLYFACLENKSKSNASVEVLHINNSLIKYYNSDSVSVLSSFSRVDKEKLLEIGQQFEEGIKECSDVTIKKRCNHHEKNQQQQSLLEKFSNAYSAFHTTQKYIIDTELNKTQNIAYLYHEIKYEKPHFEHKIRLEDFDNRILCVKTKMSDPRIQAQQGLFLLFGIYNSDKSTLPKINSVKYQSLIKNKKILVDRTKTKEILEELKSLGMSKERLFPDFSYSGKTILEKYKR